MIQNKNLFYADYFVNIHKWFSQKFTTIII